MWGQKNGLVMKNPNALHRTRVWSPAPTLGSSKPLLSVDRNFSPAGFCSHSFSKKNTEVYKLFGLLLRFIIF